MMKAQLHLCLVVFFLTLVSCGDSTNESIDLPVLFDVDAFVSSFEKNNDMTAVVRRTLVANGESEIKVFEDLDVRPQLEYLRGMNINNPTYLDKYEVKSNPQGQLYLALDSTLAIRRMEVLKVDGVVEELSINHRMSTLISSSQKTITFIPDSIFSIHTVSKSLFGKERDLLTKWEYL